tara:strand:+ start:1198 stop:1551 length:354 start_codon:yes stop_codon:yes gene_type:complete
MSLTVDTRGVANHEKVCYVGNKGIDLDYSEPTKYLAWVSMAIGIGEITSKNYHNVYFRHVFLCRANGNKCPITLQDVKNNIGLKTNVSSETKGKWKNRIVKSAMNSLWYEIMTMEGK